jgi:hypothetical protein
MGPQYIVTEQGSYSQEPDLNNFKKNVFKNSKLLIKKGFERN